MLKDKYVVNYVDELPNGIGGRCEYPMLPLIGTCRIDILIKYKNDIGILNHELKHCEQYHTRFFHAIRTILSKSYRYSIELEAYTEQIRAYGYRDLSPASWIVDALLNKYNLGLTRDVIDRDINRIIRVVNGR